ncbi:magnesium transporter [archaeon]|nr:magnesium transporter [archaeon]
MVKHLREIKRIVKQSVPFLLIAGVGELAAGVMLGMLLNRYTSTNLLIQVDYTPFIPGVLVILPSLMNLRGAISSTFAARLGSAHHLGLMRKKNLFNKTVVEGIKSSFVLALISSTVVAMFAYVASQALGIKATLGFFLFVAITSSLVSALLLGIFTAVLIRYSIKKHLDPDNITIPLITTIGDLLLVLIVYILTVGYSLWSGLV